MEGKHETDINLKLLLFRFISVDIAPNNVATLRVCQINIQS